MSDEKKLAIIISSIIAAVIGVLIFLFHPVEKTGRVKSMFWERTIYMEEFMKVEHSGKYMPPGGELIRTINRSKRVRTGTDSKGNPVYTTKYYTYYYYYLQEWRTNGSVVRTYGFDKEPYWDEEEAESRVKQANPHSATLGDIRIGKRTEEYIITFNEYNKDHELETRDRKVSLSQYMGYKIGAEETYKVAWVQR
jgi:hypothetical protein